MFDVVCHLQRTHFFFSSRRRHTICYRDWSSDVCSSDLQQLLVLPELLLRDPRERGLIPRGQDVAEANLRSGGGVEVLIDGREVGVRAAGKRSLVELQTGEIGRASCRERVERGGGDVGRK